MWFIIGITVFSAFSGVLCESTLDYYENLIHQRTTAAQDYEIPEGNFEFSKGANSPNITDIGSYDFIIIGAGTAGNVLATRLSEIDKWNILLLEAGGEEDDFTTIPSMFMFLQFSEMNWGYTSTPQKNGCLGMKGKRCNAARGKAVGGSSAINAALYSRGNPKDFDKWAEMGNPGWSFKEVLPYFIKSENSQIDGDPGYHGTGGFWNVEYSKPPTDLHSIFIKGNEELKRPIVDYNGKNELGISKIQHNIKVGKKQSTATAFLNNARKRTNLKVITKALVTKIIIDEKTKTAEGVVFVNNNAKFSAKATKEVLVSGGTFNSPQLLMLSGIGPKEHLEELGIKVIADLPVGKNLLDHPIFQGLAFHTNYSQHDKSDLKTQIKNYLNGYGTLTAACHFDGIGFIQTKNAPKEVPTIEYLFMPPRGKSPSILSRYYNFDEKLTKEYLTKFNAETDIIFFVILLHQKSKGRVTLKSSDPIDFPNIDLNLFSEPEDINTMIEGIEFIMKLADTEAFQQLNAKLIDIPICKEFEKYSKLFWKCAIRHMAMTLFHPTGTTSMGPDRVTSVVDANLKVHGIEKLRVVDAGVMPTTTSGHTAAPTVMIAEKISDVIKKHYHEEEYKSPFRNGHHYTDEQTCHSNTAEDNCYQN